MDRDAVDRIARGRVWSGDDAKELKLVDQLGGLDQAVAAAAKRAKLADGYRVWYVEKEPTLKERLTASLLTSMAAWLGPAAGRSAARPASRPGCAPCTRAPASWRCSTTREGSTRPVCARSNSGLAAGRVGVGPRPAGRLVLLRAVRRAGERGRPAGPPPVPWHGGRAGARPGLAGARLRGAWRVRPERCYRGPWFELASYAYWSLACFVGYLLAPGAAAARPAPG